MERNKTEQRIVMMCAGLFKYSETSQNWPALGPKKKGQFRGVAGFMRLLLQRIVKQGLKNLADILGDPVF
jgi:hypothetical protein